MKLNLNRKYAGNALLVTVILSLVIFMLMSAAVLLAFYNRVNEQRSGNETSARTNLASAVNFVLSDTTFNAQTNLPQDIFTGNDTVNAERGAWGICQFAAIRSVSGATQQKKAFLYGAPLPAAMNACLYLADHGRPLSLAGNTMLNGDVYISPAGITAGYVDQRPYQRVKLVEGTVKYSKPYLPETDQQAMQHLAQLMKRQTANTASVPDSLTQSFFSPAHIIYQKREIVLAKSRLKGRIIVQSDSLIVVDRQCMLDNVILIAPRILFREGFRGRVQSFASQEIIAEDNCSFLYPSCLILQGPETMQNTTVQFGRNCSLEGILMSLLRTEVNISPGSIISGVVYTTGHTVLQGKVNGIVLTDFFRYRSATAEYENYLADAEINRSGLSAWFIGPPVFSPSSPRKVMTWLE